MIDNPISPATRSVALGALALAVLACGSKESSTQPVPSGQLSAAVAAPSCSAPAALLDRVPQLLAQGRLDRAARVLREAAKRCPDRAPEQWVQLLPILVELGRVEEVESLLATLQARPHAPQALLDQAKRALESLAPLRSPPADLAGARRLARKLFAQATLEPDKKKAEELFLKSAETLPPGGPALYQAARLVRSRDPVLAQRLFDRALNAVERSAKASPVLALPSYLQPKSRRFSPGEIHAGLSGRLVLVEGHADFVSVLDAIGWRPRFDLDGLDDARTALSEDAAVVVAANSKQLVSCSLLEASCASLAPSAKFGTPMLSADGETLAIRDGDSAIGVYDAATLTLRKQLKVEQGKITAGDITAAGERVAAGLANGELLVFNTSSGEVESRRKDFAQPIKIVRFDPKDTTLLTSDGWAVRLGGVTAKKSEEFLEGERQNNLEDFRTEIYDLVVAPDGKTVFAPGCCLVQILSLADKGQRSQLPKGVGGRQGGPYDCAEAVTGLGVSGQRVYVAYDEPEAAKSSSNYVRIHKVVPLALADGPTMQKSGPLAGLSWSEVDPDMTLYEHSGKLFTVRANCGSSIWDLENLRFASSPGTQGCWDGVWPLPDGRSMLGLDFAVPTLIDKASGGFRALDAGEPYGTPPEGGYHIVQPAGGVSSEALQTAFSEKSAVWVDEAGSVHYGPRGGPFTVLGKSPIFRQPHLGQPFYWVLVLNPPPAISPSGKRVLFRTKANEAQLYDAEAGKVVHTVPLADVSGLAFGEDDIGFVSSLAGAVLRLEGTKETTLLTPNGGPLVGIAPALSGRLLAGAVSSGPIHLWSVKTGELQATLLRVGAGVLASLPDGTAEFFGKAESDLDCRVGPFVFGTQLCRERLVEEGALKHALAGQPVEP